MDAALQEINKKWVEEVTTFGKTEASIRCKQRQIDFYCELGIMRDGEMYEWKPGHFEDSRKGALPVMWQRFVLNQSK